MAIAVWKAIAVDGSQTNCTIRFIPGTLRPANAVIGREKLYEKPWFRWIKLEVG